MGKWVLPLSPSLCRLVGARLRTRHMGNRIRAICGLTSTPKPSSSLSAWQIGPGDKSQELGPLAPAALWSKRAGASSWPQMRRACSESSLKTQAYSGSSFWLGAELTGAVSGVDSTLRLSDPEPLASKDVAALKLPRVRVAEQDQLCQVYHGWDYSRTGWLGSHGKECCVDG